jgi:predicted flap endonuclease-1-like 5' DNA nuclease
MKAHQRLFITACATALVAEGDPLGASLYAAPGDDIPDSAAEKFGLVDGKLPAERKAPPTKEGDAGATKEGGAGATKEGDGKLPDDLTVLKGVGAATAAALQAAGLDSFAAIAGVDPERPPEVEAKVKDWSELVDQAKALASTEPAAAGGVSEPSE